MSAPVKLTSPRYRIVLGDYADESTWEELTVQALTRDLASAETLFAQRKWGKPTDSAIKLLAVSAYFALRRTGQIEGSWDDFEAAYLEVGEDGGETARPTQPVPETGS